MKSHNFFKALPWTLAMLLLSNGAQAIKITVPDQYKDQVEAIKQAERKEREQELEGVAESAEGGIEIAGQDKPEPEKPAVDADEFLVQSVIEATDTAAAMEANLSADEGIVSGQVVDKETGEPVSGAAILIEGTDIATVTDDSGRYSLGPAPAGIYTLSFIKTGYIEANITEYTVAGGEVSVFPFALPPRPADMSDEVYELQDFTVTAEQANDMMMKLELRMDSDSFLNVMSSEDFSRFASSDAAEALIRVAGVSVQEGKYAVIRGLAERYVTAQYNGQPLTSPDPDRLAVQLDIFPSSLLENVVVRKTFTPDMPGESTGGSVDVITKSIPDERIASFSLKTGGNSNVAGEDKIPTDYQGREDWLANGFDSRDFPADPTEQSLRTTFDEPQLNVGPFTDLGMSFNYGDSYDLSNDRRVGFIFGAYYDFDYNYREEDNERWEDDGAGDFDPRLADEYTTLKGAQESTYAFLLGGGYELSDSTTIRSSLFFICTGESEAEYTETGEFIAESSAYTQRQMAIAELSGEHNFDLGGDLFKELKLNAGISFSNNLQEEIRRGHNSDIVVGGGQTRFQVGRNHDTPPSNITRTTDQDNLSYSLDLTLPVETEWNLELKSGYSFEDSTRTGEQTDRKYVWISEGRKALIDKGVPVDVVYNTDGSELIDNLDELANMVPRTGSGQTDAEGVREIEAYYLMATVEPLDWVEVTGGARVEKTFLQYSGEGNTLQVNFPVDFLDEPIDQTDVLPAVTTKLKINDNFTTRLAYSETVSRPSFRELSPFVSLNFTDSEVEVGNSPISWVPSGNLGPPPPPLEMGEIKNYDIRFEYVADNADMVALSFFYKEVQNAIERTVIRNLSPDLFGASGLPVFSWVNNDNQATVQGVEFEFRKGLGFVHDSLENFAIGGNVTYIESEVDRSSFEVDQRTDDNPSIEGVLSKSRSLQGQPDLLLNADISYSNEDIGTDITLAFNYQGEQLESIGDFKSPDRYLQPYIRVDATWKQRINDYWTVKLAVENITDSKRELRYDSDQAGGRERLVKSYTSGVSYSISASCEF